MADARHPSPSHRREAGIAALALLCVAQFMVVLDVTVVAVALPAIQRDLGFSTAGLQWVVTAYTLVFGAFLVPAGRAADLAGRRRMLVAGLALFSAASLACGLAPSAGALVALRAVQGLGAAIVAPAALSLLTAAFPDGAARRRAVAAWTAAAAGGGASGWVLGGLLTEGAGWEWVFLVNVPVGIGAALLTRALLDESRDERGPRGLDAPGALAIAGGLALLVLGLTRVQEAGLADPGTLAALGGAVALLAAFAVIERRADAPLLPSSLLRTRPFTVANAAALALTASTTPPVFLAVLYQQKVLGLGAVETGLACAPLNLAVIGGSAAGPRVAAAVGTGRTLAGGLLAIAAGALLLVTLTPDSRYVAPLLPAFLLMGAGLGCASVAATASGTAAAGDRQGVASGVLNAAAQVGTVLGLAALISLAAATSQRWAFVGAAVIAVAAAGLSASRSPSRARTARPDRRRAGAPAPARAAGRARSR